MKDSSRTLVSIWGAAKHSLMGLLIVFAVAYLTANEPQKSAMTFPKQVLLIRHAEKPPPSEQSVHITEQGEKRAQALFELFEKSSSRPDPFPKPDFIFAARNSENSHRALETVTPLAKKLKLPVNDTIQNLSFQDLRKELFGDKRYQGKTILICWHHGTSPDLARALGAANSPGDWDHKAFDRVWQLVYDEKGRVTFLDRPQRLLPGDSKK